MLNLPLLATVFPFPPAPFGLTKSMAVQRLFQATPLLSPAVGSVVVHGHVHGPRMRDFGHLPIEDPG